jgi:hypothetical protein
VSDTAELLLGVIAVAVLVMALIQVGAVIAGLKMARRLEHLTREIETGIKPVLTNLTTMTSDASRAATVAASQVERFDKLVGDLAVRVDQTMAAAQQFVTGPAREGMAIVAGIKAAMTALQGLRESARRRSAARPRGAEEEEESLFIG